MSEYASIQDAFGVVSLASQEPPILRGHVGKIQAARHKKMASTIHNSNPMPDTEDTEDTEDGYAHDFDSHGCVPGAGLCVGAGRGPRDMARCSAGTTCPACAQRHPTGLEMDWGTLPVSVKIDIFWRLVRDVVDSQLFILAVILLLVFYIRR